MLTECFDRNPEKPQDESYPQESHPQDFPADPFNPHPALPPEPEKPNTDCKLKPLTGVVIAPNYQQFSNADDYMRYWLAWEIANPCHYRGRANCMGAALEVSLLYTKPWNWQGEVFDQPYYDNSNGYGEVENWSDLVDKGYFNLDISQGRISGNIITYRPYWISQYQTGQSSAYPTHMTVVTNHNADGQPLCFEKQSPTGHYQLRLCSDRGDYTEFVHPYYNFINLGFQQETFTPVPNATIQ